MAIAPSPSPCACVCPVVERCTRYPRLRGLRGHVNGEVHDGTLTKRRWGRTVLVTSRPCRAAQHPILAVGLIGSRYRWAVTAATGTR
jgi:hypothetical protein